MFLHIHHFTSRTFFRDRTTNLQMEMLQDLYKTELLLVLWYLRDQIIECVQTLSNTNLLHINSVYTTANFSQARDGTENAEDVQICMVGPSKNAVQIQMWVFESLTSVQLLNTGITRKKTWVGPNDKWQGVRLLTSTRQHLTMRRRDMSAWKVKTGEEGAQGEPRQNIAYYFWGLYCLRSDSAIKGITCLLGESGV